MARKFKPTAEQKAKSQARRDQFKALWKQVADMPEDERIAQANKLGIVSCEGHGLSMKNQLLIAFQNPAATVVGGFRQWMKMGRVVSKGQHGLMIWVPTAGKSNEPSATSTAEPVAITEGGNELKFLIGTVFDISQTEILEEGGHQVENPETVTAEVTC